VKLEINFVQRELNFSCNLLIPSTEALKKNPQIWQEHSYTKTHTKCWVLLALHCCRTQLSQQGCSQSSQESWDRPRRRIRYLNMKLF